LGVLIAMPAQSRTAERTPMSLGHGAAKSLVTTTVPMAVQRVKRTDAKVDTQDPYSNVNLAPMTEAPPLQLAVDRTDPWGSTEVYAAHAPHRLAIDNNSF
jgi:hypothetical protein